MELATVGTIDAQAEMIVMAGNEQITIPAGKHFKIETSPSGVEVLSVDVPVGKQWVVNITVTVQETDAA